MPEVPMIATGSFKYRTRRLMAGDEFHARNDMDARILSRVRKVADFPKVKAAPAPVAAEAPKVEAKAAPKPAAKAPAKRKAKAKK